MRIGLLLCEYLGPIPGPLLISSGISRQGTQQNLSLCESNENEMIGDRNNNTQAEGGRAN